MSRNNLNNKLDYSYLVGNLSQNNGTEDIHSQESSMHDSDLEDFDDLSSKESIHRSDMSTSQIANSSHDSFQPTHLHKRSHNSTKNSSNRKKLLTLSRRQQAKQELSEEELQDLRLRVNSRERKRMHDLNSALDSLREVMPYAKGASVRKLSKIATLVLAKNYILLLSSSLEEMRRLLPHHPLPPAIQHLQLNIASSSNVFNNLVDENFNFRHQKNANDTDKIEERMAQFQTSQNLAMPTNTARMLKMPSHSSRKAPFISEYFSHPYFSKALYSHPKNTYSLSTHNHSHMQCLLKQQPSKAVDDHEHIFDELHSYVIPAPSNLSKPPKVTPPDVIQTTYSSMNNIRPATASPSDNKYKLKHCKTCFCIECLTSKNI